jgi:hypothetical protein
MGGNHIGVAVAWQRASSGDWMTYAADVSRRGQAEESDRGRGQVAYCRRVFTGRVRDAQRPPDIG